MSGFQNILVPVDFSEGSRRAILYGSHFASCSKGSLHLLNVITDPGVSLPDATMPLVDWPTYLTELREAAQEGLAKEDVGEGVGGFNVTREVAIDFPADGILQYARKRGADLICIGTHGRTGLSRLALGSVAERVVQYAPCPVLVARSRQNEGNTVSIHRILVAVDLSEFNSELVALAHQVAADESAEVELVNVIEEYSPNRSEFSAGQPIVQEYLASIRRDAEKRLAAVDLPGVRLRRQVLIGRPFVEINRYAAERQADLIVLGTHGRTGIRHWMLGSVAEMVVRKAPCSVLVMPQRAEADSE